MAETVQKKIEKLEAKLTSQKQELAQIEQAQRKEVETQQEELTRLEEALEEARWLDALQKVDKQLGALYRKEREKEADLVRCTNELFQTACAIGQKRGVIQNDLDAVQNQIRESEKQLVAEAQPDRVTAREALVFKKAELAGELEVPTLTNGATTLLGWVRSALGQKPEDGVEPILGDVAHLPVSARRICHALKAKGGKLRSREDRLMMLVGITEPQIVKARDQLAEQLEQLQSLGLLNFTKEHDTYEIKGAFPVASGAA